MKKWGPSKIIGTVICVVVVGVFLYSTFVSNQFTMEDAIDIAEDYAPDNTIMVETDQDHKAYEIAFASEDYSRKYEFEVNKARHGISQIELSTENDQGGRIINFSSQDVEDIIEDRFNHLKKIEVALNSEDGFKVYNVAFKSAKFYGEAEINPENGHILDMTISYLRKATPSDGDFNFEKAFLDEDQTADKSNEAKSAK